MHIKLEIINITGQIVLTKDLLSDDGAYESEIDVSQLPADIYVMLIKTETGVYEKRFVKK